MPKIVIEERDLTTPGVVNESTDVVYIPGFVNVDNTNLYDSNGTYIGIEQNVPTFIDSISKFESLCGTQPALFDEDQLYTALVEQEADGSFSGFPDDAVPYDRVMFHKNQPDPAYVMAKEILSAGLPIIYERVNADEYVTLYRGQIEAPNDWKTEYSKYEIGTKVITALNAATPPTMFTVANGKVLNDELSYFIRTMEIDEKTEMSTGNLIFTKVDPEQIPVDTTTNTAGNTIKTIKEYVKDTIPYYYTLDAQVIYEEFDTKGIQATESDMYPYYLATKVNFANKEKYPIIPTFSTSVDYFIKNLQNGYDKVISEEAPTDWGSGIYYTIEAADVTEKSLSYESNKYYKKVDSNYELVSDAEAPVDWTTEGLYFDIISTQVEFSLGGYEKGINYIFNKETNFYTPIMSDEAPSDWGSGEYFTIAQQFTTPKFTGQMADIDKFIVSKDWLNNCLTGGAIYTLNYSPVESSNTGAAPDWDSNADYRRVSTGINIKTMYNALKSVYAISDTGLSDKGNYSIKYLTSGGYPTYEYSQNSLVTSMIKLCKERGDCVAFIDHTNNPHRNNNIDQPGSLYYAVNHDLTFQVDGDFATMFTPWAEYNRATVDLDDESNVVSKSSIEMPGSFAYFLSLADSINNAGNPNWLAIAGVARGLVQNLAQNGIKTNIPNGAADKMSPRDAIAINPITNIKPYGYTIWGNRTLKKNAVNLTATSFLSTRNLVSEVKKSVYRTARKLTFEQNSDVLWVNFKAEISPLLDKMLHGYGITGYKLLLDTNHPRFNERATLCVKIILSPVDAVEDFYVSIILQDDVDAVITE